MKKIKLILMVLLSAPFSFAWAQFSNCNYPTQTKTERTSDGLGVPTITYTTMEVPQGHCEGVAFVSSILDCRNLIQQRGYSCYQTGTYSQQSGGDFGDNGTTNANLCWGCLN